MVEHGYNHSIWEVEGGRSQIQNQYGLHSKSKAMDPGYTEKPVAKTFLKPQTRKKREMFMEHPNHMQQSQ